MKKFILKILIVVLISIIIIFLYIIRLNFNDLSNYSLYNMPLNNVSNSPSFKAKIDHLDSSENFKKCTFVIAGSSMSLNNISGNIIHHRTNECVYNISSWGLKPNQVNQFLEIMDTGRIKYILVAFNNCDFGKAISRVDFNATKLYLSKENKLKRFCSFIDKFNINTFAKDWSYRVRFTNTNSTYYSLHFDSFGSVQFEHKDFVIETDRWNDVKDTTGFYYFYNNINKLFVFCKQRKITFILAYLPSRPNLLTNKNIIQNKKVSELLRNRFGKSFLDMQDVKIPLNQYCDGFHLFKEGAESITNSIIDSLRID